MKVKLNPNNQNLIINEIKEIVNKYEPEVVVREVEEKPLKTSVKLGLKGLDCGDCAAKLERSIGKIKGVQDIKVDFLTESLVMDVNSNQEGIIVSDVKKLINKLEPEIEIIENKKEIKIKEEKSADKSEIYKMIISLVLLLIPKVLKLEGPIAFGLYIVSYLIVAYDILIIAFRNLKAGQALDENFLMSIASIGAFFVGEYSEGILVMLLYKLGEYFQGLAVNRSRRSISALMDIRPDYANLERNGEIITVDPDEISIGEIIVVRPGEKIPLDGIVVEGNSSLDTSNITGESVPRKVKVGEEILSGSVNNEALLKIKVEKTFGESTISKILDLVENASSRKAPTEDFITKFARYYTPIVVAIAAFIGLAVPLLSNFITFIPEYPMSEWLYRAFTFLVISCPCALVISVPLGFFGGIGGASKEGILIKGGNYLEALSGVNTIVFDKTGTITQGVFEVTEIEAYGDYSSEEILELTAYGESHSSHPIGLSIIQEYGKYIDEKKIGEFKNIAGKGLDVEIDNKRVLIGNEKLLVDDGIKVNKKETMGTIVYIGMNNEHIGTIVVSDRLKENVVEDIKALKNNGVENTIMLSGDKSDTAEEVGKLVGLDKAYGNLLPQDKVQLFEEILVNNNTGKVAFVGDGVNDAPALARSDIGIAMGGLGSDAAIEASDIVIMTDEIGKINTAINISKKTKRIVTQNIVLSLGIKLIVLILGALGKANMMMAVFADVGVAIIAIFNSIRVLRVDK